MLQYMNSDISSTGSAVNIVQRRREGGGGGGGREGGRGGGGGGGGGREGGREGEGCSLPERGSSWQYQE